MKKTGMIFVFAFLSILFLNFVSAYVYPQYYYSSRDILDNIVNAGAPILELLFGDYTGSTGEFSSGEMLFVKFLIFLILFVIIQTVLKQVEIFKGKDNKPVVGILSIAIPLIAVRFMSANNLIYGIMLPYGTLGIALTTLIPFMVFFFFIHGTSLQGTGRKLAWGMFLTVFLVLWFNRADQIGEIGNKIYGWTSAVILIVLAFDRQIHANLGLRILGKFFKNANIGAIASLKAEYNNLLSSAGAATDPDVQKRLAQIRKELKALNVEMSE